jgi:uncharacterized protein with NRDE domain
MCTLLVWKQAHAQYPLIAAANRDEHIDRPAAGPQLLCDDPVVVGGRDLAAGGTWLALSARGVLAALTNRIGARDPSKRSRGNIVLSVARSASYREARASLAAIESVTFNPFALLLADRSRAVVLYGGGDAPPRIADIGDGVHALTNWELDARSPQKAARALSAAQAFRLDRDADAEALAAALHALLADHGASDSSAALCVHRPQENYGTRSSSIVFVAREPERSRMFHAEGPPCAARLADVSGILCHDTAGAAPKIVRR